MHAELLAHLEALTDQNMRHGVTREEALQAARREFGGVEQAKELYRERRGLPLLETLLQDVRRAMRLGPIVALRYEEQPYRVRPPC